MDEETYGWAEWQAKTLAGLILVPRDPLAKHFKAAAAESRKVGLDPKKAGEPAVEYISSAIAKKFEVSPQAIQIRLLKDGLIEPQHTTTLG